MPVGLPAYCTWLPTCLPPVCQSEAQHASFDSASETGFPPPLPLCKSDRNKSNLSPSLSVSNLLLLLFPICAYCHAAQKWALPFGGGVIRRFPGRPRRAAITLQVSERARSGASLLVLPFSLYSERLVVALTSL